MVNQFSQKEWAYSASPGFVVRYRNEIYQKRHLETGQWFESDDPTILRQITEDGRPLTEIEAEEVFRLMQKRHQQFKEKEKI